MVFKLIIAQHREYEKEEFRWAIQNEYLGMVLSSLGYKNIKKYSDMLQEINGNVIEDNRSANEIIEDVLSMFKDKEGE